MELYNVYMYFCPDKTISIYAHRLGIYFYVDKYIKIKQK